MRVPDLEIRSSTTEGCCFECDLILDLRDSRERVERLEAALREIKGESEAFQEYEHAAPDTFQRITALSRDSLAEPVAP